MGHGVTKLRCAVLALLAAGTGAVAKPPSPTWPANLADATGFACKAELVQAPEGLRWRVVLGIAFGDDTATRVYAIHNADEGVQAAKDCARALRDYNRERVKSSKKSAKL